MTIYRCDRCNKELKEYEAVTVYVKPNSNYQTRYDAMFDLCEDCADAFEDWLCGKEKNEGGQTKGR